MSKYKINKFPKSRIATIDVCEMGKKKHHVAAFLEIDVTSGKEKIKKYKKDTGKISFIAWLIKVIGFTVAGKNATTAYLAGKQKTIIFDDFGVGSVMKKPLVIDDKIEIRDIMYLTVLIDHDVIDGASMARFISALNKNIEAGMFL